jgi:hypothetical protein
VFCCTILRCSKASIFGTDSYRCIVLQTTSGQEGEGGKNKTHEKENGQGIPLIASSKGGAGGEGLGPGIVSGVDAGSETLSSPLLGRRTTLRPEKGAYLLLESGVGKKVRSGRSK